MNKLEHIRVALTGVQKLYGACMCCGHACLVNRLEGYVGICNVDNDSALVRVASCTLHFGEEPAIVGVGGSGTVFFSGCNLNCVYCQNHQISHGKLGNLIDTNTLASEILNLQSNGATNINLVSATHVIYPVLLALEQAVSNGLNIPIVYNCNGYESMELLGCLEGVVDIYLPDIKYSDNSNAMKYSNAKNYFETSVNAISEMHRQVGILKVENDIALSGIIIRHLVLPENKSGTYDVLIKLKDLNLTDVTLSLMSQYSPKYKAFHFKEIDKKINKQEYQSIVEYAIKIGFTDLLVQDFDSAECYLPDFELSKPFNNCT